MKYYAKLVYNGKAVGYRYKHKDDFYDVGAEKKEEFNIIETNQNSLKMVVVGNDVMTEVERDTPVKVQDITNKKEVFDKLLEEDRLEEEKSEALRQTMSESVSNKENANNEEKVQNNEIISANSEPVHTSIQNEDTKTVENQVAEKSETVEEIKEVAPINETVDKASAKTENTQKVSKKLELSVKPTKKKVVTSKGVGLLIVGEDETLVLDTSNTRYLAIVNVTSKTAIGNLNKILGAKFSADARSKDFDKGKKEFKLRLSRDSVEEIKASFGVTPCLSQKQGFKYTLLNEKDEKVVNTKIRLTDFAVPKNTEDTLVGGKDNQSTLAEYRANIFNKIENGQFILLADL